MNNVNDIKENHLCYGCGTCSVICARQAITMEYDNIGRLLPVIDDEKCTDCGLCRSNCPGFDSKGIQMPDVGDKYVGHVENVYIGKATDTEIYRNSQSGGLVTATLKFLFETGRIDAAVMCRVDDAVEYTPKAVVVTSADELTRCQKSSYVPVDIVSALKQAEQYQAIAVVGTGCHIQGTKALQNFSRKYKDKIKYKLGLICDRTLCKTITDVLYGHHYSSQLKRIVWRDKSKDYKTARLVIKTSEGEEKELPRWKRFVLKEPFTNPRCRICFDKLNTQSDIVFGDPWGMSDVDWKNGMSVVITRTKPGAEIIHGLIQDGKANLTEAPLSEVITGQHIEKRKKDVSSALSYYQWKGWLLPNYAEELDVVRENTAINKLIDAFLHDAAMPKEDIIRKNKKFLLKTQMKSTIKRIMKLPLRVAYKIIKR